jgi:hypothetical protein
MIDTLKLSLTDYKVSPGADLIVQPSSFNAATGELCSNHPLWHDGACYIEGSKAFHNGEDFNVTLKPMSPSEPGSVGCFVQFSVPKVATGDNFYATDYKGTAAALATVEKYLRDVGVRTNIKTASLSRLDAFKTVQADEPYQAYHPILSMLQGQRMAKRDYGTTFLWANTVQEICVYDKVAEMEHRRVSVLKVPANSLRFEFRMLKARKVQDMLGMRSAADLLNGYDHVATVYQQHLHKQLFQRSVSDVAMLTARQFEEQLRYYKDDLGKRFWCNDYLMAAGMRALAADADALKQAAKKVSGNRVTAARVCRQIEAARLDAVALEIIAPAKRPLCELYDELKSKVLAA